MKKKNGFTLIELLAVLAIMSTIALVSVIGIMNTLDKREKKECTEQIEMAIGAAKVYFSLLSEGDKTDTVSLDTLLKNKYISDKKNISRLNLANDTITFVNDKYVYNGTQCEK